MTARELKQIAALLASVWTALLILFFLIAPLGLALADEPAGPADQSAASSALAANDWDKEGDQSASNQSNNDQSDHDQSNNDQSDHDQSDSDQSDHPRRRHHRFHAEDDEIVSVGHDAVLDAGRHAASVVSVGGEARSAGDAGDVVSVFGGTRVTGPASGDAVAVFGSTYVDSAVEGDVVSVFGDVELGPHAKVGGDVVSAFGTLKRDPAAEVQGSLQSFGGSSVSFGWLRPWITQCLMLGRPLALDVRVAWAWGLALIFFTLCVLLALAFPRAIDECVGTLETEPGRVILASFLMVLLVPLALILLAITFIGLAAWPFFMAALFCAALVGKASLLAWVGKHVLGTRVSGVLMHPAAATLVGGVLVLIGYLVPVLGFVLYNVLALLSLGLIATVLLKRARARSAASGGPGPYGPRGPGSVGPGGVAAAGVPPSGPMAATSNTIDAAMGVGAAAAVGATRDLPPLGDLGDLGTRGPATATRAGPEPSIGATQTETNMSGSTFNPAGSAPGAGGGFPGGPATGAPGAAPHSHHVDPAVAVTLPRAGFWIRMGALFIDIVIVGFVMSVLVHHPNPFLFVLAAYGAIMWKLRGSTVGDIVFDLQVARVDGRPIDWETAIIRALSCFLSMFVAGLGFFWIAFDPNHQAWHDKIAGTIVVRVPKMLPPAGGA